VTLRWREGVLTWYPGDGTAWYICAAWQDAILWERWEAMCLNHKVATIALSGRYPEGFITSREALLLLRTYKWMFHDPLARMHQHFDRIRMPRKIL